MTTYCRDSRSSQVFFETKWETLYFCLREPYRLRIRIATALRWTPSLRGDSFCLSSALDLYLFFNSSLSPLTFSPFGSFFGQREYIPDMDFFHK
jgi:hypothetical protein